MPAALRIVWWPAVVAKREMKLEDHACQPRLVARSWCTKPCIIVMKTGEARAMGMREVLGYGRVGEGPIILVVEVLSACTYNITRCLSNGVISYHGGRI